MWYFAILLTVVGFDQLSKFLVVASLHPYQIKTVIPGLFNLTYAMNTGVAFSMFAQYDTNWSRYFFIGINLLAVAGFTIAYFRMEKNWWNTIPFALIAGGAAGNVIDRWHYGSVVDFLDVHVGIHHWPTFNIADSAICVGVILFLLHNVVIEKKNSAKQEQ